VSGLYRLRQANFLFLNMKCHMKKEVSLPHLYLRAFFFISGGMAILGVSLVTTAWRFLGLRMVGRPPAMEGNCECIK
jgi:hypothetical protein